METSHPLLSPAAKTPVYQGIRQWQSYVSDFKRALAAAEVFMMCDYYRDHPPPSHYTVDQVPTYERFNVKFVQGMVERRKKIDPAFFEASRQTIAGLFDSYRGDERRHLWEIAERMPSVNIFQMLQQAFPTHARGILENIRSGIMHYDHEQVAKRFTEINTQWTQVRAYSRFENVVRGATLNLIDQVERSSPLCREIGLVMFRQLITSYTAFCQLASADAKQQFYDASYRLRANNPQYRENIEALANEKITVDVLHSARFAVSFFNVFWYGKGRNVFFDTQPDELKRQQMLLLKFLFPLTQNLEGHQGPFTLDELTALLAKTSIANVRFGEPFRQMIATEVNQEFLFAICKFIFKSIFDVESFLNHHFWSQQPVGIEYIHYNGQRLERLLRSLPQWPTGFAFKALHYQPMEDVGASPWHIPLLLASDLDSLSNYLRVTLSDIVPCYRGTIAALIASTDACVRRRSLAGTTRYMYDAYSVVLLFQYVDTSGAMPFDANVSSSTTLSLSLHAKKANLSPGADDFERYYLLYDSRRHAWYDFGDHATPWLIESYIFDTFLPSQTSQYKGVPILQYRVIENELDEATLKERLNDTYFTKPAVAIDGNRHHKVNFLAQSTSGLPFYAGVACSYFAMMFAMAMFNDEAPINELVSDASKRAMYVNELKTRYETACQLAAQPNSMRPLETLFELSPNEMPTWSVRKMLNFPMDFQRSAKLQDRWHPYLLNIPRANLNNEELLAKFKSAIANVMEELPGLFFQELWNLCHSPTLVEYDYYDHCYRSKAFAVGITQKGRHTIMIFVAASVYDPKLRDFTKPRRFYLYDSANGVIHTFVDLLQLELYYVTHYDFWDVRKQLTSASALDRFVKSRDAASESTGKAYSDSTIYIAEPDEWPVLRRFIDLTARVGLVGIITEQRGVILSESQTLSASLVDASIERQQRANRQGQTHPYAETDIYIPSVVTTPMALNYAAIFEKEQEEERMISESLIMS